MKRGDRLAACGSVSGGTATINPTQLFQRQYRVFESFATMRHITESLDF